MSRTTSSKPYKTGSQIQSAILDYVRHKCGKNVLAYKVEIASERGVPDLLCCIDGTFVGIEIKGHGDQIKPIQTAQAARIITAGGECFVVRSLDEFKQILTRLGESKNGKGNSERDGQN